MNPEIILSKREESLLLQEHRCPKCKGWDNIFYNPNLTTKNQIQIEFECNDCSLYVIIIAELKQFFSNRR